MHSFVERCQKILSSDGVLAEVMPDFVPRASQITLALAFAKSIEDQSMLIAEAGTGTGKTYSYLVPCLLSDKKTIISTATKTLQDQLFEKDLPLLKKALASSKRVYNLKGRANYLCKYRIRLHSASNRFINAETTEELLEIKEKLPKLIHGERKELTAIKEDATVWPLVTSTEDNCLGIECDYYHQCFLVQARRKAMDADIVIINHHLFFADSRLKNTGFGELLPKMDVMVFDEAHKLADIATEFYGEHKGSRQLLEWIDSLIQHWPILELPSTPLKKLRLDLEEILSSMFYALEREEEKIPWNTIQKNDLFMEGFVELEGFIEAFLGSIDESLLDNVDIQLCKSFLYEFQYLLQRFKTPNHQWIYWIERFKQSFTFHLTPHEVGETFNTYLKAQASTYLFTSATLTVNDSFDFFTNPLGLNQGEKLVLQSPFLYQEQAMLYLPRNLPDPNHMTYYDSLIEQVIPIIEACQGRCFFLFTSHKALKQVAVSLATRINFPLLIQGDEAKPILLARFRQLGNAVLLGTATFWEGVDVKGALLSCVIIDKLPFPSPEDPIIKGKAAHIERQGHSGFVNLSLPTAILALKQGAGRLIRDITDKGVLILADPRLTSRAYGEQVFKSLPNFFKTRELEKVLKFIEQFDTTHHEVISD